MFDIQHLIYKDLRLTKSNTDTASVRYWACSFGWSHGKEIMNGKPDTLKGSYYANPVIDYPTVPEAQRSANPEYYGRNIWPAPNEDGVEGFEQAFKDLGRYGNFWV